VALLDIQGAAYADIFIKILTASPSPGAFGELGARVGLSRVAHVIENCHPTHLFHHHPLVRRYPDLDEFCKAIRRYMSGESQRLAPFSAGQDEYTGEQPF